MKTAAVVVSSSHTFLEISTKPPSVTQASCLNFPYVFYARHHWLLLSTGDHEALLMKWARSRNEEGQEVDILRLSGLFRHLLATCGHIVPEEGLEPSLSCDNWILNPARLPIPPLWLPINSLILANQS